MVEGYAAAIECCMRTKFICLTNNTYAKQGDKSYKILQKGLRMSSIKTLKTWWWGWGVRVVHGTALMLESGNDFN